MASVLGIHHVTAIASDPQKNLDFYVGLLGLRLVKRTVNFDDPQSTISTSAMRPALPGAS
jgi:glyoxalase family protein